MFWLNKVVILPGGAVVVRLFGNSVFELGASVTLNPVASGDGVAVDAGNSVVADSGNTSALS